MIGYYGNTFVNKAPPLTCFKSWPSFMLIGRLISEIDHPQYFLYRIMCDPLLNLPESLDNFLYPFRAYDYRTDLILGEAFCVFILFNFPASGLPVLTGLHF